MTLHPDSCCRPADLAGWLAVYGCVLQRCPMLSQVEAAAYASQEYAERNSSNAVTSLNKQMANALPGYNWKNMLDCLMTTACTGRQQSRHLG